MDNVSKIIGLGFFYIEVHAVQIIFGQTKAWARNSLVGSPG